MEILKIIRKKSNKEELTKKEINYFVTNFMTDEISELHASILLTAIKINGMTFDELFNYTNALIDSGKKEPVKQQYVDKHSTGGIGDKISIILLPIIASMGLKVKKVTGKSLGFTGGTVDKLSSIEDFKINLTSEEAATLTNNTGISITSQIEEFAPADLKIYSLRNKIGASNSIPLIAASIVSKKIAAGAKSILIDVKVGIGAFIENLEQAKILGSLIKKLIEKFDRKVVIVFTSMSQPIGHSIGNSIEVEESINYLSGTYSDVNLNKLIKKLAVELFIMSKGVSKARASYIFEEVMRKKLALTKFYEMLNNQGANEFKIKELKFFHPNFSAEVVAPRSGFLDFSDLRKFGYKINELANDPKDDNNTYYHSGVKLNFKKGDWVMEGDVIMTIYGKEEIPQFERDDFLSCLSLFDKKIKADKIILGKL